MYVFILFLERVPLIKAVTNFFSLFFFFLVCACMRIEYCTAIFLSVLSTRSLYTSSMFILARSACAILLYGPYCIVGYATIRKHPQLFLIWLFSVIWAYVTTYWMTSLLYVSILPKGDSFELSLYSRSTDDLTATWDPWCSAVRSYKLSSFSSSPDRTQLIKITIFVFEQLMQFSSKTILFFLILHINSCLRRNKQMLLVSYYRFVPVGATVGLGYAGASLLLTSGTLLDADVQLAGLQTKGHFFPALASSPSLWNTARSVTAYDLHVCPQLPVVVHRSLQSFLYSIGNMLWGIIHCIAIAAFYGSYLQYKARKLRSKTRAKKNELWHTVNTEQVRKPSHSLLSRKKLLLPKITMIQDVPFDSNLFSSSYSIPVLPSFETCPTGSMDEEMRKSTLGDAGLKEEMKMQWSYTESTILKGEERVMLPERVRTPNVVGPPVPMLLLPLEEDERASCTSCEFIPLEVTLNPSTPRRKPDRLSHPPLLIHQKERQHHVVFPEDSIFSKLNPGYAYAALLFAFFYSFFFLVITLRTHEIDNRSVPLQKWAFSCTSHRIIPDDGCVVSLYVQFMLTSASLLFATVMARTEYTRFFCREVVEC